MALGSCLQVVIQESASEVQNADRAIRGPSGSVELLERSAEGELGRFEDGDREGTDAESRGVSLVRVDRAEAASNSRGEGGSGLHGAGVHGRGRRAAGGAGDQSWREPELLQQLQLEASQQGGGGTLGAVERVERTLSQRELLTVREPSSCDEVGELDDRLGGAIAPQRPRQLAPPDVKLSLA